MKKLLSLGLAALALMTSPAFAASGTWNASPTDGTWVTTGTENNWSNGVAASPGATTGTTSQDVATFLSSSTTGITINSPTLNLRSIIFGAASTSLSSFTIGATDGNSLFLSSTGTISLAADVGPTNTSETINAPLVLEGSYTFNNSNATASNVLNIGGAISNGAATTTTLTLAGANSGLNTVSGVISDGTAGGVTAVTKLGAGTWILSGNNTYTGLTSASAGVLIVSGGLSSGGVSVSNAATLDINSATALGTGTFTIGNAATIDNTSGAGISVTTVTPQIWSGSFTFTGSNSLNLGSGAVSLAAGTHAVAAAVSANVLTVGGNISDAAGNTSALTKTGAGTLALTGNILETGVTGIGINGNSNYAGTLLLSGDNSAATGGVTIYYGALDLNSAKSLGGLLTISNSSGLSTGAVIDNTSGSAVTLSNNPNQTWSAGFTYTGTNDLNMGTGNVTMTTSIAATTTAGNLTEGGVIGGGFSLTKAGAGTLTLTGANTYTGATVINAGVLSTNLIANGGTASGIGASGTTSANLTLGGGTLQYTGATQVSNRAFGLSAGTNSAIEVTNATTNLSLVGGSGATGSLTKLGAGTLTLTGTSGYGGTTTVAAGTLNVTGSLGAGSAVTVGNGTAGAAILSGTGTVNGSLITSTVGSDIAYIAPGVNTSGARGDFGSAGTLKAGSLGVTLGDGTALDIDLGTTAALGGTTNDLIAMSGGTLTLGANGILTIDYNLLGGSLATGTAYTLINGASSVSNFNAGNITSNGIGGYTASYSVVGGALEVTFSASTGGATGVAYFNGQGTDLNTAANYDTSASSGTAVSAAPSATTNVNFAANRNASTTANISGPLTVNSVTFGAGSAGTQSGITVTSTDNAADNLTIEATSANGNTAGNGITVSSGSDTISAPVILGASQSWTTGAGTSLLVSGQISDGGNAFALTKAGAGTLTVTNNNIYTGGTTIGAGAFYANNAGGSTISNVTSSGQTVTATNAAGSATGTGAVTVQSTGILAGSGTISGPVTLLAGATLSSGAAQSNAQSPTNPTGVDTVTGTGLTLTSSLAINAGSSLSFALGAGASTGYLAFSTPNLNSTYLSFTGNTAGEINFGIGAATTINFVDLTAYQTPYVGDTLGLRQQNPYLLMAAGADSDYANLVTTGGLDQNGYVLGVGTDNKAGDYTPFNLAVYNSNGQLISGANNYGGLQLYLYNGDLEVVPEPGTWALMLGGLALLVIIQRRKNQAS
ncbi:MAG TPA: autotransporter-associated beta strand repeat-containing protein [Candidatus Methylacidiphilales bacterium]